MSGFERLLEPGCTERPACRCGQEMEVARIELLPEGKATRMFACTNVPRAGNETRLTVWAAGAV